MPADSTRENFDFHGLIEKAAGFKFDCEYDHVGFWDLRVAVAEHYQRGRVFIAGDAAHSHPPYGGFGLNNGLEDAVNLGWKLAARLQGWGGDALLRSYSEERRPIFEETAEDFIAARIKRDGEFLNRYSPERDKRRVRTDLEGSSSTDVGWRVQNYEPNYEGSPVVAGPPGGVCSAHGEHMVKARAGTSPDAAAARPRAATYSTSWARASRCWHSMPMTRRSRPFEQAATVARRAAQGGARHLRRRARGLRSAA